MSGMRAIRGRQSVDPVLAEAGRRRARLVRRLPRPWHPQCTIRRVGQVPGVSRVLTLPTPRKKPLADITALPGKLTIATSLKHVRR
jgi:hypothetical protein